MFTIILHDAPDTREGPWAEAEEHHPGFFLAWGKSKVVF